MIEPKFIELMNMELDGALPERDRTQLHEYLSSAPEATKYFEGLRAAVEAANSVEQVEPPAGLRGKILDAVPFSHPHVEAPLRGFAGWRENWFTMPRFRYAAFFVFGIAFGVLVYSAMNYDAQRGEGELNISHFLGTMKQFTSSDGFKQTRAFDVDLDRVQGQLNLHESDRLLLAEVALDASGEIDWVVEYDARDVSFDGYRSFNGGESDVTAAKTEMRVHQTGDTHYLLFFTRKSHPVTPFVVKIFSADRMLLEHTLSPAAKSAE